MQIDDSRGEWPKNHPSLVTESNVLNKACNLGAT